MMEAWNDPYYTPKTAKELRLYADYWYKRAIWVRVCFPKFEDYLEALRKTVDDERVSHEKPYRECVP